MNTITTFLGEPMSYWVELQKRVDQLEAKHLIQDLAILNAKVKYYETMLDRINEYRKELKQ